MIGTSSMPYRNNASNAMASEHRAMGADYRDGRGFGGTGNQEVQSDVLPV